MGALDLTSNESGEALRIEQLPKTALQAIYHAVTGKTETLTKSLNGNVIVRTADIDRLFGMIVEKSGHYDLKFQPTVTVVVKCGNGKSVTYSSWERYQALRVDNHDVTSDVNLKLEFVIKLPNTDQAQRFTINVAIDSSLPIISSESFQKRLHRNFGAFVLLTEPWNSVEISIDFVDFLVAKIFCGVVEDWFKTLSKSTQPRFNSMLLENFPTLSSIMGQFGRIGMATFLASYAFFNRNGEFRLGSAIEVVSIALVIWSILVVLDRAVTAFIFSRISRNIIPTVVLITDADVKEYDALVEKRNSGTTTIFSIAASGIVAILLNVVASFIYSYMSSH